MPLPFQIKELIAKKRDGGELTASELRAWLDAYLAGEVKDYQMAAWLMAVFFRGMTPAETAEWTRLMWRSGRTFPREPRTGFWIDKHSTGGVGDKTSLILVPLVTSVAARLLGEKAVGIPMVSGRGLGHSGGTLDKLESVPGFSPAIPIDRAMRLMADNGFFMMGQTEDLAPADRLLYALRDVTATVECRPLIVSSILSKKLSENLDGLVLDVKVGEGAFMKTEADARALAESLVHVAKSQGVDTVAIFTRMDEPLGATVGHHLEVEECADYLSGKPRDAGLDEVTMTLASWMLHLASRRKLSLDDAREECEAEIASGRPLALYREMFAAQGGDYAAFERNRETFRRELRRHVVKAPADGILTSLRALALGHLVNALGGGRASKEKGIDPFVGMEVLRHVGDRVAKGDEILAVYHRTDSQLETIEKALATAVTVTPGVSFAKKAWVMGSLT